VELETPGGYRFWVLVHHAKSRAEGRGDTEARRAGAAARIAALLKERLAGQPLVLMGDFNDNPDDRALNILESGDPAAARLEDERGPFLDNLTESLGADDQVSFGRNSGNVEGERMQTRAPGTRQHNFDQLRTKVHNGDQLFDQLLVSPARGKAFRRGSVRVFDHPAAAWGNDRDRASDHLPVYADVDLPGDAAAPVLAAFSAPAKKAAGLRIATPLPDPEGRDESHEQVTLACAGAAVALKGWKLCGRSGNEWALSGSIGAGQQRVLTQPAGAFSLNNKGDKVSLISPASQEHQRVSDRPAR